MVVDNVNKKAFIAEGATGADWKRLAETTYVDTADNYIIQVRKQLMTD
jgi:hypothetical protein